MKLLNLVLFAVGVSLAAVIAGPSAALLLAVFLMGGLLMQITGERQARLCATLTLSEILNDVLQSFKTRLPSLRYFAKDFSAARAKYGQTIIAHLPTLPTAFAHVAASGYSNNAQAARDLLTDVEITMNQWTDVPIKLGHADVEQDRSQNYMKTIGNAGYVLAKTVVDFALTKVTAANFSQKTTQSAVTTTKDTLNTIREAMNNRDAGTPRFGLINSAVFSALDNDARISSGDYYGQRLGADPFGRLFNLTGFSEIQEYPDFPTNAQNLSGVFFDERAIGIATRLPEDSTALARSMGLPITYKEEVIQDPETGLTIVGFAWIDTNTHDIYVVPSVMYGAVAGSQGGAAGAKTDYAGHRLVTA